MEGITEKLNKMEARDIDMLTKAENPDQGGFGTKKHGEKGSPKRGGSKWESIKGKGGLGKVGQETGTFPEITSRRTTKLRSPRGSEVRSPRGSMVSKRSTSKTSKNGSPRIRGFGGQFDESDEGSSGDENTGFGAELLQANTDKMRLQRALKKIRDLMERDERKEAMGEADHLAKEGLLNAEELARADVQELSRWVRDDMREGFENLNDAMLSLIEHTWQNGGGGFDKGVEKSRKDVEEINERQEASDAKASDLYGTFLRNQEAMEKRAEDVEAMAVNSLEQLEEEDKEAERLQLQVMKISAKHKEDLAEQKDKSLEVTKALKATICELHDHKTQYILGQVPSDGAWRGGEHLEQEEVEEEQRALQKGHPPLCLFRVLVLYQTASASDAEPFSYSPIRSNPSRESKERSNPSRESKE